MSDYTIDVELAQDTATDEEGDWNRRLFIDSRKSQGESWLTIHDDDSDDEFAVLLTPSRARQIATQLEIWAHEREPDNQLHVLREVLAERIRQDAKWGEQNHPLVDPVLMSRPGGCDALRMAHEFEIPTARRARWLCDTRHKRGDGTFADILVEELCEFVEAATIENDAAARKELVQLAAVAVAVVEAIDRRAAKADTERPLAHLADALSQEGSDPR